MNKEQMLKEARTIEAMRKGYMGLEGKFSIITKRLGHPIIHHGSLVFDQRFLDDPYELFEEDQIPTMDESQNSYEIGHYFDGLSRGINMTISVHYHLREIVCRFEGQIVYKEIAGELEGFAPESWEDKIDELFLFANKIERQRKPAERQQMMMAANKKRKEILEHLKQKWGL